MLPILAALTPVFLLIAFGWWLRRAAFPGEAFWPPAERLTYYVLFPALLVRELATAELGGFDPLPMGAAMVSATLVLALAMLSLRRRLALDGPAFTSVFQGALRFNTFVGLAAAAALYGSAGLTLFAVAVAVMVPLLNLLSVGVIARYAAEAPAPPARQIAMLARNPLILACLAGIALNLTGIGLPPGIAPAVDALGRASLAFGLLAVGAALDLPSMRTGRGPVLLTAGLKLLALPLLMAVTCWVFQVEGLTRTIAILWAALPSSTSAYILARQMGGDGRLMASAITASTILAALTMPLILALLTG